MKEHIITIAGAGSGHTPGIILTLLENRDKLPISEFRLYDIDEKRNMDMEVIIEYLLQRENILDINLTRTEDPKTAFTSVDFVFSQIRVGGMEMRELDEKIPLKYGLVGQETCGLGGFAYGLRSIGDFLELVEFIQTYSPDAWILNYTNPESIIAESVRRVYPEAKIINACDMTIGIEDIICKSFGYNRDNWTPVYYGLNHFGWYESIYDVDYDKDIMPKIISQIINEGLDTSDQESSWAQTYTNYREMLKYFPDYLPNNYLEYYLFPHWYVNQTDHDYTRANEIMDGRIKHISVLADNIRNNKNLDDVDYESDGHGQYIVNIAIALTLNSKERFMLIVPNNGSIPNLRSDAVVEIPCFVSSIGVETTSLKHDIPDFHKGLMEAQVAAEKMLVDAHFEQSYDMALQAFTLNQTVPNAEVAKKILDEFITVNDKYWVDLK